MFLPALLQFARLTLYFPPIMGKTLRIALKNKYGLHVRPSAAIALTAAKFQAAITVNCNGLGPANARSSIELLGLGAECGTELEFTAEGDDAEAAIDAMYALVDGRFGGIE